MSDYAVIYISLLIGFVLLIIIIRFLPFKEMPEDSQTLMYYKLDLRTHTISVIMSAVLEEDAKKLSENDYELIFFYDLEAYVNHKKTLPPKSFLIALNEMYSYSLKEALPVLIKENISLIIFLPVLISASNDQYRHKELHQLNEFIFLGEFKNTFRYTQPNIQLSSTI